MAQVKPDAETTATSNGHAERAEKITEGIKICAMVGFFFEKHNGNKKLQIGYAVINDNPEGNKTEGLSENGLIHIDSLLIRDSVMWKHQKWSGGCGYSDGYDNEDHDDIMKVILSCPAVECEFVNRSYEWRGEQRNSLEIKNWRKVDEKEYITNGIGNLISSCEKGFDKIIEFRVRRGDQIEQPRKSAVLNDANNDFDSFVEGTADDSDILF